MAMGVRGYGVTVLGYWGIGVLGHWGVGAGVDEGGMRVFRCTVLAWRFSGQIGLMDVSK